MRAGRRLIEEDRTACDRYRSGAAMIAASTMILSIDQLGLLRVQDDGAFDPNTSIKRAVPVERRARSIGAAASVQHPRSRNDRDGIDAASVVHRSRLKRLGCRRETCQHSPAGFPLACRVPRPRRALGSMQGSSSPNRRQRHKRSEAIRAPSPSACNFAQATLIGISVLPAVD